MPEFIQGDFNDSYTGTDKSLNIAAKINDFQKKNNCEFVSILSSFYFERSNNTYTKVLFKKLKP